MPSEETLALASDSPAMDFTGYRQISFTYIIASL
jgi:hypothetical protein